MSKFITKGQIKELLHLASKNRPVFAALNHLVFQETGEWFERVTHCMGIEQGRAFALMYKILEIESKERPLGDELQGLFHRITEGEFYWDAIRRDARKYDAMWLWSQGYGHKMGLNKWADYLSTIPERPSESNNPNPDVFHGPVLVDPRIDGDTVSDFPGLCVDLHETPDVPYYVWVYVAKYPEFRKVPTCDNERALTLKEGVQVAWSVQQLCTNVTLYFAGTQSAQDPNQIPCYRLFNERVQLADKRLVDGTGLVTGIIAK